MNLKLSELELRVLGRLCAAKASAGQLAEDLASSKPRISMVLKSLQAKRLIAIEKKGTKKTIRLSLASHAESFRQLYASRAGTHPEKWLSGPALDVLTVLAVPQGVLRGRLLDESEYSPPTIYRALKRLYSAGVVTHSNETLKISDSLVFSFVNAFADNLQLILLNEAGGNIFSLRVRKNVLVRTDAGQMPDTFVATGISRLAQDGLEYISTDFTEYYVNLDGRRRVLSLEESYIHAMLFTLAQQGQNLPILAIFLGRNLSRMNQVKLTTMAETYSGPIDVTAKLLELKAAIGYSQKMADYR